VARGFLIAIGEAMALVWAGCLEAPQASARSKTEAKPEAPKQAGPVDAQTAFYEVYKPARAWASDALPLTLASGDAPNIKNEGGRFGKWTAVFVSSTRREARIFTYTVGQGLSAAAAEAWSGTTPNSRPFQLIEFTVNSDAAYQTAFKEAQGWLKGRPGKEPALSLLNSSHSASPIWYILWGTKTSGYLVLVNAMTGTVVKGK
jgi:hypothetical protein